MGCRSDYRHELAWARRVRGYKRVTHCGHLCDNTLSAAKGFLKRSGVYLHIVNTHYFQLTRRVLSYNSLYSRVIQKQQKKKKANINDPGRTNEARGPIKTSKIGWMTHNLSQKNSPSFTPVELPTSSVNQQA